MKKNLSLVLALTLIMALISVVGVSAAETVRVAPAAEAVVWDGTVATSFAGGTGTQNDPYIIADGTQLAYLANSTQVFQKAKTFTNGKYFSLASSIDFNNVEALSIRYFYGNFNGNGYEIIDFNNSTYGLFGTNNGTITNVIMRGTNKAKAAYGILCTTNDDTGIIEYCSISGDFQGDAYYCYGFCDRNNGIIRYCNVTDATFTGDFAVFGTLAGYFYNGKIHDCIIENVTVNKTGSGSSFYPIIGGAVAYMDGSTIIMENVFVKNTIFNLNSCAMSNYAGGLVGNFSSGLISNCMFDGEITISSENGKSLEVGGLVGYLRGKVKNCISNINMKIYESGSASKVHAYGGLAGSQATSSSLENSIATGTLYMFYPTEDVGNDIYVGGLVGETYSLITRKNCIADCNITTNSSVVYGGQLVGDYESTSSPETENCYYNSTKTFSAGKTYTQLASAVNNPYDRDFLINTVGLNEYVSESNLEADAYAVWNYIAVNNFPSLYSQGKSVIVYCANGAVSVSNPTVTAYGEGRIIPENNGIRTGCTFVGWNTKPDGTGTFYNTGVNWNLSGFTHLYAIWEPIPPQSVTLNETAFALETGRSKTVTATVLPEDAPIKNIVWTSSNEKVATVENGKITGVGEGVAVIKATTEIGGFSASCRVRVVDTTDNLGGVCGKDVIWRFLYDNTLEITGEGSMSDFAAANTGWYSHADSISMIEIGEGVTSIGSYAFYGLSKAILIELPSTVKSVRTGATDMCTVLNRVYYNGVARDYAKITVEGSNTKFNDATVYFTDAGKAPETKVIGFETTTVSLEAETNTITVTAPSTSSAGIALITEGVESIDGYTTVNGNGITVTDSEGYRYFIVNPQNGLEQKFEIYALVNGVDYTFKVNFTFVEEKIGVESITLDVNRLSIIAEEEATITAKVLPENAINKNVIWSSSDASVATVENGVVTAVGTGEAVITATTEDGGYSATCTVVVTPAVVVEPGTGSGAGNTGGAITVANGTCGTNATWELKSDGVLTVSGSGVMKNYTATTSPWYEHRENITKIVVDGVATIGEYAFNYCANATEVVIGEGVKVIYRNAFAYCSSVVTVYLPSTLTTVNKAVFYNCSALTDVYYNGTFGDFSKITVEGSNAPLSVSTMHYTTAENAPVPQVVGLRTETASYNEETNTITAVALNTNSTAGVAIVVDGVASLSDYTTVSGNGINVSNKDGYRYFVAKLANGAEQSTEIYATVDGVTYTYYLNFSFVDEIKEDSPIADIATLRCYEASWSDTNKTISISVDRFPVINVSGSMGVAIIPAEGYTVSYELTGNNSTTDTASRVSNANTSKYTLLSTGVNTESSGGGALGNVPMKVITKGDATRFYVDITLTKGEESVTYEMTIALRDRAVEGDVDIAGVLPLRADGDSFVIDNEEKTIYYETVAEARSAGFAVKVDNGLAKATRPRRLLTAKSGMNLAHGDIKDSNNDDYDRYVVARRSAGITQTYQVKVHGGADGLSYTWYTVTVVFK